MILLHPLYLLSAVEQQRFKSWPNNLKNNKSLSVFFRQLLTYGRQLWTCWTELDCRVVWKVENGQFKAEKWSGHLIQTDTWLDLKSLFFWFLLFFFFSVHSHLCHCRGSVKRVKEEDKATAGYRLSNSRRSPGETPRAADHFHSWLQSFKSSNNARNEPLPPANSNKRSAVVFTESDAGSHSAKFGKQSFHANKTFYQGTSAADKQRDLIFFFFFLSRDTFIVERQQTEICTRWAWKLVRVNVHLLAAARLLRRDAVQQAAKVKIYTEQLQRQKLTLDDMGCMINHGGQGALDSKSRRRLRAGLRREGANQGFTCLAIWKKDHVLVIYTQKHTTNSIILH